MYKPGESGNPNGRPKGSQNKATKEIREAYQRLVETNLDNMTLWLSRIASEDEEKAFDIMLRLSEYVIPKLARQEVTGKDGDDLFKSIKFDFGPDVNDDTLRDQSIEE